MNPLEVNYFRQAGRGGQYDTGIGTIYSTPSFLQRGQGIGNFFGSLFRWVKPVLWKEDKAFGLQTLHTGGKILSDIAENRSPEVSAGDIVSRHKNESTRNLIGKLGGIGHKRTRKPVSKYKQKTNKKAKLTEGHFLLNYISRSPVISEETVSISSEFDDFARKPIQTTVLETIKWYTKLLPPCNSDLEFLIPDDLDTYIGLEIKFYIRGKLMSGDGKDLDANGYTAVTNNFLLFIQSM